jgi:uncharacterized membrane protein YkvI
MVLGIAATFIGTVIGAGFASGQEVLLFFSRFGRAGWGGLVLATVLLGIASNQVFRIGLQLKTNSYRDFLAYLLGVRLLPVADLIFSLFLILLVGVMFAGSGAIFAALHLQREGGVVLTGLILIAVLSRGLSGMVKVNLGIIPLMFLFCLVVTGATCRTSLTLPCLPLSGGWLVAALQFTAYNFVLAIPVLLGLVQVCPDPVQLRRGAWLGSIALGILAGLIHWAILTHFATLERSALPMLTLAKQVNAGTFWGYSLILWGEMFTTLLANVYGLGQRLCARSGRPFLQWVVILCILGIAISYCGFAKLIAVLFPIYGCLSLILLILLFCKV